MWEEVRIRHRDEIAESVVKGRGGREQKDNGDWDRGRCLTHLVFENNETNVW